MRALWKPIGSAPRDGTAVRVSRSRPAFAGATTRFFFDLMIWIRFDADTFFDRPQFLAVINLLMARTRL